MKRLLYTTVLGLALTCTGCSDFLEDQVPQGTIDNEQLQNPEYVDNLVISAYAVWISAEDINSSFSMWNFDVRSDDAYKGGNGTEDGDVFHKLEISQGIMTTDWNISDMWQRLYNCISRVNAALQLLNQLDESTYPLKQQRIAEMRFLRGHGHFLLKQLYKNIVFANDENLSPEEYNNLSNTTYTNDEGWQLIADDFQFAYDNLPDTQADKGRPTKAAAAGRRKVCFDLSSTNNNIETSFSCCFFAFIFPQQIGKLRRRTSYISHQQLYFIVSVRSVNTKTVRSLCGQCSIP